MRHALIIWRFSMAIASVNGIELYYEVHGSGPPVVFAHGAGGNHGSWYQQVPFFARSYQVITIDQRGFGQSADRNGLGRSSFVEDVRALLDSLGIERTALVAQSMGGSTCLGFAVRYPQRTRALVMADTLGGVALPEPWGAKQRATAEATRDLSQLERVMSRSLPLRDPAKAELYLQLASFNPANDSRFAMPGAPAAPITLDQAVEAAGKVPVLFLVGAEDVLQPPEIVRAASELVPGSEFTVVPDSGHSVYFEQPEVFNYRVGAFLAQHE
jgi:pimeloyl-ACP methyl ester carboxylesterase